MYFFIFLRIFILIYFNYFCPVLLFIEPLSNRFFFSDAVEDTESYVKPTTLHDQNADVSDQSIHAQEYAVTLSDPPSSSSDIGTLYLLETTPSDYLILLI